MSTEKIHLISSVTHKHHSKCLVCGQENLRGGEFLAATQPGDVRLWNQDRRKCTPDVIVTKVVTQPAKRDPNKIIHHTVHGKDGRCLKCGTIVTGNHRRTENEGSHNHDFFSCKRKHPALECVSIETQTI